MDEKDKEIAYKIDNSEKEPLVVKEARTAVYTVDAEAEYEKFLSLPEMLRVEFIDGQIYYLAAANTNHQKLLGRLAARFHNYLHGKSCDVYMAPFDVKIDFDFNPSSKNTLQPDLLIICNDEKLSKQGLNGAPDFVIEILSPSDPSHDKVFKYNKYLSVGVKEYWIVDPVKEEIIVNLLISNRYMAKVYAKGDAIKVSILDDLYIDVTDIFEGYKGDEIVEVETARKQEHASAESREQLAREEERAKAEAEKLEIAKRLLDVGFTTKHIAEITGIDLKIISTFAVEKRAK